MDNRFLADPAAIEFLGKILRSSKRQTIPINRNVPYEEHISFPFYSEMGSEYPLEAEIKKSAIKIILDRKGEQNCVELLRIIIGKTLQTAGGDLLKIADESNETLETYMLIYTHDDNKQLVELKFVSKK